MFRAILAKIPDEEMAEFVAAAIRDRDLRDALAGRERAYGAEGQILAERTIGPDRSEFRESARQGA